MFDKLLPLPEPRKPDEHGAGWFTAGQMRVYARAAIEANTPVVPDGSAIEWFGIDGTKHTMGIEGVKHHMRFFYEEWPCGISELESEIARYRKLLAAAPQPNTSHFEEIYEYLCNTSPKGYADEAFRNVPDSLLSTTVRDRLAEQGSSLGQNARAIPEHAGSPESADGRDGQPVTVTVAQPKPANQHKE